MVVFTNFSPFRDETNVARTAVVSFTMVDDGYGIDINTLSVKFGTHQILSAGSFIDGYTGRIFSAAGKHVVGIYPTSPFFERASKIDIYIGVNDGYGTLNSESYSFYTAGYNAPASEPITTSIPRSCPQAPPFFPPTDIGLVAALDSGVGTEVELQWKAAAPHNENNVIFYNVYYSTDRSAVFDGYPDFIVSDTEATIGGLAPGDMHHFGVRVTEFDPLLFTISGLQQAGPNMFFYPMGTLDGYISASATFIPAATDGFPQFGIIHLGTELVKYGSLSISPPGFVVATSGRGYAETIAEPHANNIAIRLFGGREDSNTKIVLATPTFQKPNYALTWVRSDGYGADGYRDGYDGYDAYYNAALGANRLFDGYDGYYRHHGKTYDSITTDGTNNDNSGTFPRLDYCGTWRAMSPQSFMQGQCRPSYFGGAQIRFDDDGYRHLVKVPDVRTHMLQREELLLESTGEPLILLRRMWTGTRCLCYMNRREHPDARCPVCFVPGSLVNTKNGYIPIENVKVGDYVLSDDGTYNKVNKVMEREFDGYLRKIETHSTTPLLVTPEHPFLTILSNHEISRSCGPKCSAFIENGDGTARHAEPRLLPSNRWWARVTTPQGNRISLGTFNTRVEAEKVINNYYITTYSPKHKLDWKNAENISVNDWLVNKWSNEIKDIDTIKIPSNFTKKTKLGSKRNGVETFHLNEEFLWIVGMYIAEGSHGARHLCFSLHKNEVNFQKRIVNYFKNLGFNSTVRNTSENGVAIEIYSTSLSKWFPEMLGTKCYNKKIPEDFMTLPNNKLKALLQGIYDGDGNKAQLEIGQTSKILAFQIIDILHRLGKQPLMNIRQSEIRTPKGNKRKPCYIVSWESDDFRHNNRKGKWDFKEEVLVRVKNSTSVQYKGKVYNLEVDERHTYVVENIVVHNCFSTGFVQGYVQFFNPRRSDKRLLVRIDPATDDLNIVDRGGLEPMYEPNGWTLPFPAIKDRDILIRFNPNNTEEFRYEVLDVTRVRAMFTQTGAQKLRIKRLPKTDIAYQFPAVRDTSPTPGSLVTSTDSGPGLNAHSHQLVLREGTDVLSLRGATLVAENHNHIVVNGIVQPVLGHTHTL